MRTFILLLALWSLCLQASAQTAPVRFIAQKEQAVVGSATRTVAIRVKDFSGITTTQFTLQWPSSTFQFASVSDFGLPNLDATHFNTTLATTGKLTFSWDDASTNGITLSDDTVIFKINFNVFGTVPPNSLLEMSTTPTPTEVTRLLIPVSASFTNENLAGCDCD